MIRILIKKDTHDSSLTYELKKDIKDNYFIYKNYTDIDVKRVAILFCSESYNSSFLTVVLKYDNSGHDGQVCAFHTKYFKCMCIYSYHYGFSGLYNKNEKYLVTLQDAYNSSFIGFSTLVNSVIDIANYFNYEPFVQEDVNNDKCI